MGPVEYLVYTLLFLVLIGLIGIIGYYIYDNIQKNEEYKKELTSDLNTNFVDINKNFDSTSTNIDEINKSNGTKITLLDERLQSSSNLFSSNFADVRYNITGNSNLFSSNFADVRYNIIENSNLFATSNTVVNRNFNTFNTNLNKYFEFDDMATLAEKRKPFNNMNTKLFEYVTSGDHIPMLDLISKTTATAGLKINTDSTNPNNDLEICDKTGQKCFNISSDNDNLYIYPKGTARADAPFKIVAATAGGKAYANINGSAGSLTSSPSPAASGATANAGKISASPSSLTTAISFTTTGAGYIGHNTTISYTGGGGGIGLEIGDIVYNSSGGIASATIKNSGSGYTETPIALIAIPGALSAGTTPVQKPVTFYATGTSSSTALATFTLATVLATGAIYSSLPLITPLDNGYYSSPTVTSGSVTSSIVSITNNSVQATATVVTTAGAVTSITITNPLDNGFYIQENAIIESIGNGTVTITKENFAQNNFTYTKVITDGVWNSITVINGGSGFPAGTLLTPLTVKLSAPETAVAATITPTITKGSITSLTLTTAGSKYYKPTISVPPIHLVTPAAATMPTLYKLS
jgi:hypothetical protein